MATFLGDRESLTPGSKRKRTRQRPSETGDGPISLTMDSDDEVTHKKKKSRKEKKSKKEVIEDMEEDVESIVNEEVEEPAHVDASPSEMSADNINTLLARIEACCVKEPARMMSWACQQEKLDWEAIAFSPLSATECKQAWLSISTKVRKFRTLSELISDARDLQQKEGGVFGSGKKKQIQHPDLPKKPLSGYLRFFLEKRKKYSSKHPELKGNDFTRLMGRKFTELADHKKKKYNEAYQREMEEFKVKMEKFKAEHPDLFPEGESGHRDRSSRSGSSTSSGPPKTVTAQGLFIQEKIEQELAKDSSQSRRELYTKYQEKWMKKLSEKKKWKYIEMAIEAKKKYDADMEEYCKTHPEYQPKLVTTFLTKAEQKIKDEKEGKPTRPPSNAYQLFTIEVMTNSKDIASNERMDHAARLWKAMSAEEKEAYSERIKKMRTDYFNKLTNYVEKLSEDEQYAYETELMKLDKELHTTPTRTEKKAPKKSPTRYSPTSSSTSTTTPASKADRKPVSAFFLYVNDHKDEYMKKHPNVRLHQVSRLLVDLFKKLPPKQKEEYERREAEQKQKLDDDALAKASASAHSSMGQKQILKELVKMGEPQKPYGSGYLMFSKEKLKELTHIESSQRMKAISEQWKNMTEEERAVYNNKRAKMWRSYVKKHDKFITGLSETERKKYFDLKGVTDKTKKKYVQKATTRAESASSSSEESEDEDKDKEADSGSSDSSDSSDEEEETVTAIKKEQESSEDSSDSSDDDDDSSNDSEDQKIVNGTKAGSKGNKLKTSDVFDSDSNEGDSDVDVDNSDSDDDDDEGSSKRTSIVKMSPLKKSGAKTTTPIKIAVPSPKKSPAKGKKVSSSSSSEDSSSTASEDSDSD